MQLFIYGNVKEFCSFRNTDHQLWNKIILATIVLILYSIDECNFEEDCCKMFEKIVKYILSVFVISLTLTGCQGFYDAALNGPGVIYAVDDDDLGYKELLISGGKAPYRYSTEITAAITDMVVSGDSRVIMNNDTFTVSLTPHDYGLSGTWTNISGCYPANTIYTKGNRHGVYALDDSGLMYEFDEGSVDTIANIFASSTTLSLATISNPIMFTSSDDGEIYIFVSDGLTDSYIYRWDYGTLTLLNSSTTLGVNSPIFGDKVGAYVYIGTSNTLYRFPSSGTDTPVLFNYGLGVTTDYAIIDKSTAYCVDNELTWVVYKINMAIDAHEAKYDFGDANGEIRIEPFRGNLAMGIKDRAPDDGLYIYDISDNKMKQIHSSPILALQVR
jgi:hypothetical protein